jgi:hypothetical protein
MPPAILVPLAAASLLWAASPAGDEATIDEPPGAPRVDPALRIDSAHIDPHAVQQALELRVGEGWRRWSIEVDDAATPGQVDVRLRDAAGHVHVRSLTLEGQTVDERSRALASSLALLVEQLAEGSEDDRAAPPIAHEPEAPPSPPVSGFVALGPRMALNAGAPAHVDAGASLVGGAWLVRDHLVPVAEIAWAHGTAGELTVDAIRAGAGVLGGAAVGRGRVWGGGGALMRAQWAQARASTTAAGWWANPAVMGAIQYRGRILMVGAWLGADLLFPALRARGDAHALRWSMIRPMVALHVGVRLPPR